MSAIRDKQQRLEEERRMRRAAVTAALHQPPPEEPDPAAEETEDNSAAGQRHDQRALWVDAQIRNAMARGEFDDLPGTGKPIPGIDRPHDPDWWVKRLVERENITVLPPALALRGEDAGLDQLLDREATEADVRRLVDEFNQRVVEARRQLLGGPPVITPTRDVDQEVAAWRERRQARRTRTPHRPPAARERRQRWWRRNR